MVTVGELRGMLAKLEDDDEILVCPPPMEEMRDFEDFLEISHVTKWNEEQKAGRKLITWLLETEV